MSSALAWALGLFVLGIVAQRLAELAWSARTAASLAARGAIEHGAPHFPLMVVLHTLFPVCLVAEVLWLHARPGLLWPLWLALWLAAEALRWAAIRALGDRWNVRIWVIPGEPLVTRGPYRWMRHPNYVAVVAELFTAPLVFGAWRTAIAISLLNLVVLRVRIRAEEQALGIARPADREGTHQA